MANKQLMNNYKKWGQADGKNFTVVAASSSDTTFALDIVRDKFDLNDLRLATSLCVESYRGPCLPAVSLILLRFLKNGSYDLFDLGGEHLTILIDIDNKQVHGSTNMFYKP